MRIDSIIRAQGKSISFEFFPSKNEPGETKLFEAIRKLEMLKPSFVSMTYGAGGGTRRNTRHLVIRIKGETSLNPMPHLTCVGQSKQELRAILEDYKTLGFENILALRGDPPQGTTQFVPQSDGFCYARDLVELTASFKAFSIGIAVYPEGHVESPDLETDMFYTKQKIDAGAHFAITQMFFENRFFYDFLERADRAGIRIPIIPGIMPILDIKKIGEFCQNCGATFPQSLISRMEGASPEEATKIGVEFATEQGADLLKNGVRYFHFYTLNRAEAVTEIFYNLNLDRL